MIATRAPLVSDRGPNLQARHGEIGGLSMEATVATLGETGQGFLSAVALSSLFVCIYYGYVSSGIRTRRAVYRAAAIQRLYELGSLPIRKRDVIKSEAISMIRPSSFFRPWKQFKVSDDRWVWDFSQDGPQLQSDDFNKLREDQIRDILAANGLVTSISARWCDSEAYSQRRGELEESIYRASESMACCTDSSGVRRVINQSKWMAIWDSVRIFKDEEASSNTLVVVYELIDYVSRGTAIGLLAGILVPVNRNPADTVSVTVIVGAALGLIAWQRTLIVRAARYALSDPVLYPNAVNLDWCARRPGATLAAVYTFSVVTTFLLQTAGLGS